MTWTVQQYETQQLPPSLLIPASSKIVIVEHGTHASSDDRHTTIECAHGSHVVYAAALPTTARLRRSVTIVLQQGARAEFIGFLSGSGEGKVSLRIHEDHVGSDSWARTVIRGVFRDHTRLDLRGLLSIRPTAVRSDGFFDGRAVLLGSDARAEIVPSLEIETQDVRASHAAAVGSLDPEQLFYCQSRGCTIDEAQSLILGGLLAALIERIPIPARALCRARWQSLLFV
jgi:Fe-S cluster assembly scaffold protein SufB